MLWLAGAALDGDQRLLLWIPALALDLAAPVAGYWLPGRGRAATTDYDIEGGHFAERCQLFIIIALGESIVVTGATAADAGLTSTVVLCLVVAFLETAALWWLYFGAAGEHSRAAMSASDDPGRLARDAYTYLHLPIVAGIIATAVGANLLIAEPGDPQHGVGLAMVLGGPALYLLGENLFQWRMTGKTNTKRLTVAALLILLVPLGGHVAALLLGVIVTALLVALAVWELRRRRSAAASSKSVKPKLSSRDGSVGDQPGVAGSVGAAIGVENADQHLGHDPTAARAELLAAAAAGRLGQEVEPQRCLAHPAGGAQAQRVVGERVLAHRPCDRLAGGQAVGVSPLEVAAGERSVGCRARPRR